MAVDGQFLLIIALVAFVCWRYRDKLFRKQNPGVKSGFDPNAPGVTVQDIIRAYHVDPPKDPRPPIFDGNGFVLLGLIVLAAVLSVVAVRTGYEAPTFFAVIFAAAVPLYWYVKGGRQFLAHWRPKDVASETPAKRPSTPADKQAAANQLRLAYSIYNKEFFAPQEERPDFIVMRLAPASVAINKARALDPSASLTVDEKEGKFTYTVDSLSALFLFWEASMYDKAGRQIETQAIPDDVFGKDIDTAGSIKDFQRERERRTKQYFPAALVAAEKAVLYEPRNPDYLRMLAICYRDNDLSQPADAILKHALKIAPNDIETLRLMQ